MTTATMPMPHTPESAAAEPGGIGRALTLLPTDPGRAVTTPVPPAAAAPAASPSSGTGWATSSFQGIGGGLDVTGLRVRVTRTGRPVLVRADDTVVDTWREGYPYRHRLPRDAYQRDKRLLQVELLKLQTWIKDTGGKLVVICEGRDAAGKGGTIKRFTERLNPRGARVVALDKPTDREKGQWYFQRYLAHLPGPGEIVLFDRSWYNRAGVERVMGFTSPDDYDDFMQQVPLLESMLVCSGIHLVKLWFSVTRAEQRTRFLIRQVDPVRRWKLSPMDLASLDRWDAYTQAKRAMFARTHTDDAPWTVVNSNDKERARLEAMRHVLSRFDYPGKDRAVATAPDPLLVETAHSRHDEDHPARDGADRPATAGQPRHTEPDA